MAPKKNKKFIPKTPYVAVDCAVINKKNEVLLIKKTHNIFKDQWALPGGHVDYGETVEKAVAREAKEEVGLKIVKPQLFGVYSDPKRDPRYHIISLVYIARKFTGKVRGDYESSDQKFFKFNQIPKEIAADHRLILNDIRQWLKKS